MRSVADFCSMKISPQKSMFTECQNTRIFKFNFYSRGRSKRFKIYLRQAHSHQEDRSFASSESKVFNAVPLSPFGQTAALKMLDNQELTYLGHNKGLHGRL